MKQKGYRIYWLKISFGPIDRQRRRSKLGERKTKMKKETKMETQRQRKTQIETERETHIKRQELRSRIFVLRQLIFSEKKH